MSKTEEMPVDFEANYGKTWEAAFRNIVKPDMEESWNTGSLKWFVLDQTDESKRKPGNFFSILKFFLFRSRGSKYSINYSKKDNNQSL